MKSLSAAKETESITPKLYNLGVFIQKAKKVSVNYKMEGEACSWHKTKKEEIRFPKFSGKKSKNLLQKRYLIFEFLGNCLVYCVGGRNGELVSNIPFPVPVPRGIDRQCQGIEPGPLQPPRPRTKWDAYCYLTL